MPIVGLTVNGLPFIEVEGLEVVADADGPTIRFGISIRVD